MKLIKLTKGKFTKVDDADFEWIKTHCRAGWVEHLTGEAGYLLAKQTATLDE